MQGDNSPRYAMFSQSKMVRIIVGNMQKRLEKIKPQHRPVNLRKAWVLQAEVGAEQRQNQVLDVAGPKEVMDIVGNTEDEEKDIWNNRACWKRQTPL